MCGPMLTVRRPTASRARSHGRSSVATTSLGLSRRRSGHPAPVHRPQSDARQCRRPDLIVPFEANLADAADDFEPLVSAPIAAINRELTRASTASGPRIPGQVWNSGSIGAWGKWDANRPPAVGTGRADECVTLTLLGSRGRAGETRLDSPWRRQRARMGAWSAAAVGLSLDSPGAPSTRVGGASVRTRSRSADPPTGCRTRSARRRRRGAGSRPTSPRGPGATRPAGRARAPRPRPRRSVGRPPGRAQRRSDR